MIVYRFVGLVAMNEARVQARTLIRSILISHECFWSPMRRIAFYKMSHPVDAGICERYTRSDGKS
jgi:hypothetical protein